MVTFARSIGVALAAALCTTWTSEAATPRRHLQRSLGDVVAVEGGVIRGAREGAALAFRAIPFAAPPLGENRWRPPAPVEPWAGVRDATAFGPRCPQFDDDANPVGGEDCLQLNLWAPTGASTGSRLPVLFFIHGGGHVKGSASQRAGDGTYLYDGGNLAARAGAVVVTAQYRLGPLGFVAHPAFAAESPEGVAGNYGTLDLVAALEWVERNVARFGGDPSRVMIFGESAGAVETCMLLVSPRAAGLFSAALMQSGGCVANGAVKAAQVAEDLASATGCAASADTAGCLRAIPAWDLLRALPMDVSTITRQTGYQPNVDGVVIPDAPLDVIASGRHNRVPLVVGANADETARESVAIVTEAQYREAVLALAGGSQLLADVILDRYPVAEYGGSPRLAFTALTSDVSFICPARKTARAALGGQAHPVYRYFFTHPWSNGGVLLEALGAFHGIELAHVFDHLTIEGYRPTAGELALRDAIVASWRALAATGSPSPAEGPIWPPAEAGADPYLDLGVPIEAGEGVRTAQCDFWESLAP
ncbi:MAG: carboxylesterase family protein [Acidobacteriota bacterium]